MPPGKNMDDFYTIFRSGMWRLAYKLTSEGRTRFFSEFLPLLGDSKTRVLGHRDSDSWYLVYIGTKTSGQRKGYAKRLINHVTEMCDEQGKPCYLESSNEVNPKIYGKYGFKIRKTVYLQREAETVSLDLMVREPIVKKTRHDSFMEGEKINDLRRATV
jgi:ribosomal protein S18 acetylase RimI-like enzyme